MGISRADQDAHALESYRRASAAWKNGSYKAEVVPVSVPGKRGSPDTIVAEDEEFKQTKEDKIPTLKPVFKKDGTVTAANSSKLNGNVTDGCYV
jgi:acetyl-CoA C-acetyltransferase